MHDMNTLLIALFLLPSAGLLALLIYVQRLRVQLDASRAAIDEQQHALAAMQEQLGQIAAGEVGMGRRLDGGLREITGLRDRLDDLESAQQSSAPYATAIRMAEQGVGLDGLVDACGLTRAEAELVLKLHCARENGHSTAH
jgi:hypothetical protein